MWYVEYNTPNIYKLGKAEFKLEIARIYAQLGEDDGEARKKAETMLNEALREKEKEND